MLNFKNYISQKQRRPFFIAEIANSHGGDINNVFKSISELNQINVDAIKFQIFTALELTSINTKSFEVFKKIEFKKKEWLDIFKFLKLNNKKNVFFDVFGDYSSSFLINNFSDGLDGIKIHSSDINNLVLIKKLSKTNVPIILSSGGCTIYELKKAIDVVKTFNKNKVTLMHGFQSYPTKIKDLNLIFNFDNLKKNFPDEVLGYADHTDAEKTESMVIPFLGFDKSIFIIEKHYTIDRSRKLNDYYSSLNLNEFKSFIKLGQNLFQIYKSKINKKSLAEISYRKSVLKVFYSKNEINQGEKTHKNCLVLKRVDTKFDNYFNKYSNIVGLRAKQNINKNEPLSKDFFYKRDVIAVLACRANSSRLYCKPLQKISSITILEHIIKNIRKNTKINKIILAISEGAENLDFVSFANKFNLDYTIGSQHNVLDRIYQAGLEFYTENILRITTENPFTYLDHFEEMLDIHIKEQYDLSTYKDLPDGTNFEIIKLDALEKSLNLGSTKHKSELCSLFIHENKNKFKINYLKPIKKFLRKEVRLTVDNLEDLKLVRIIYKKLKQKNKEINMHNILNLLDENIELLKINSHFNEFSSRLC